MSRILLVSHDFVGERMAGPAIRALELGRQLAARHEVTLAVPGEVIGEVGLPWRVYRMGDLPQMALEHDLAVVGGLTLALAPGLAEVNRPVVVDIYDPFTLENLQLLAGEDMPVRLHDNESLQQALMLMLSRGDYFVCASEKQRDFWMGMLHAAGRLNPHTYDADRSFRSLVDVVPFGVPAEAPHAERRALKGIYPGIGPDDLVGLWGGGVYDWFDPLTAIRAVAQAAERDPRLKLFFMGVRNPNPAVRPMRIVGECIALSDNLGLTGRSVFFNDWVPYHQRAEYLLDADWGISLHLDTVETAYSFRTRVLDYLWAGLPILGTDGDAFSQPIVQRGMGVVVPPGEVQTVAEGMLRLAQADRRAMGTQARALARELTWERCVQPLVAFADAPHLAADRAAGYRPALVAGSASSSPADLVRKAFSSLRHRGVAGLARDVRAYAAWRRTR